MSAIGVDISDYILPKPPTPAWGKALRRVRIAGTPAVLIYQELLTQNIMARGESTEKFVNTFDAMENDTQRFNFVYNILTEYSLFNIFQLTLKMDKKDEEEELKRYHSAAAEFFHAEFYPNALECLTECIKHATDKRKLAYAYGCRARILAQLDLYAECIEDYQRAADLGIDNKYLDIIRRDRKAAKKHDRPRENFHGPIPKIPYNDRHGDYPFMKNCLDVVQDPIDHSRRYFANRPIDIGEVVAVTEPPVYILSHAENYHCHHCLVLCYNPIPCDQCATAVYCSEVCQKQAFGQYHQIECGILKTLLLLIGHYSYLQVSFKASIIYKAQYTKTDPLTVSSDKENYYDHTGYEEMCKLMKHAGAIFKDRLLSLTIAACFMFYLLKNTTDFFKGDSATVEEKYKHFLMAHIRMAVKFSLKINEMTPKPDVKPYLSFYGEGIFPFESYLEHSCMPNVSVHHYGVKKVYRAARPIQPGDIINIGQAMAYYQCNKTGRLETLQYYDKFCKCRACEENWPQLTPDGWNKINYEYMPELMSFTDYALKQSSSLLVDLYEGVRGELRNEPNEALSIYLEMTTACHHHLGNRRRIP